MSATKANINWTSVSFNSTNITRVTNASVGQGGNLIKFKGDTDLYPTIIAMVDQEPHASITTADVGTMMGFTPGTVSTLDMTLNDAKLRQRRRRRFHAGKRRLRERRHAGPARAVRLGDRDLAVLQLRRVDQPAVVYEDVMPRPDALFLPQTGGAGRIFDRVKAVCQIAEPLLEVDYAGRRAGIHPQAAARPAIHHPRPADTHHVPDRPPPVRLSRGTGGRSGPTGPSWAGSLVVSCMNGRRHPLQRGRQRPITTGDGRRIQQLTTIN